MHIVNVLSNTELQAALEKTGDDTAADLYEVANIVKSSGSISIGMTADSLKSGECRRFERRNQIGTQTAQGYPPLSGEIGLERFPTRDAGYTVTAVVRSQKETRVYVWSRKLELCRVSGAVLEVIVDGAFSERLEGCENGFYYVMPKPKSTIPLDLSLVASQISLGVATRVMGDDMPGGGSRGNLLKVQRDAGFLHWGGAPGSGGTIGGSFTTSNGESRRSGRRRTRMCITLSCSCLP